MQAGPLQSYLDKWLAACPWQRQALVFVDGGRCPGHLALAAWEFELLACVFRIREPAVAIAKLHWWAQELEAAGSGSARHPLTEVLFDQPQAARLPADWWTAPVLAALEQLEQSTPPDFERQLAAMHPLYAALARLENGWWFGPEAAFDRAARLASCGQLLHQLGHLAEARDREVLPLPMQRLARHHLSRQDLAGDSAGLDLAIREQAGDLLRATEESLAQVQPLSVFRQLQAQVDRRLMLQLSKGGGHAAIAAAASRTPQWQHLWQAWRAARQWRAQAA